MPWAWVLLLWVGPACSAVEYFMDNCHWSVWQQNEVYVVMMLIWMTIEKSGERALVH